MHHVTKVEIEGFWDNYDVTLNLFPQVTFLIGQNGTGKTTIINLIAAALSADFRNLDRIPFKRIQVYLSKEDNNVEPRIIVTKSKKKDKPFDSMEFKINSGHRGEPDVKFSLDDAQEQIVMRRFSADRHYMREMYRGATSNLSAKLRDLVDVNWISVNRTPSLDNVREDKSYESTVDQRIEEISNRLVRFFSTLSGQKDVEVKNFQEYLFVSLLEQESRPSFFATDDLDQLSNYNKALSNIFSELHVPDQSTEHLMAAFMKRGNELHNKFRTRKKNADPRMFAEDAVFLFGLRRISAVVSRWNELQKRLTEIFSPRDNWIKIGNDLFQRKDMVLTPSNELQFISRTGKILTPQMLSSGEKQLLILLSETLLQRQRRSIFIADEPELSLHVLWQEKLIGSLRALNPYGQIIAATHSPDIVGPLSKNAINMESLLP